MKAVVLIIILSLSTFALSAQERFTVLVGAGIGSYKMESLKALHDEFLGYPLATIDRYPSYFYYSGEVHVSLSKLLSLGLIYRLQSTGSKIAASDYSGVWAVEQVIRSNNVGIVTDFNIWSVKRISLSAQLRAYYGFTKYSITQNIEFNQVQWPLSWANDAKGTSITLNPDVTASYRVWNNVFLAVSAGYAFDFGGDITISSPWVTRKEEFDWSGVRVGLSASYKF